MKLYDFLNEIEFQHNNWNDYGYVITSSITLPGLKESFRVKMYPNDGKETFQKIKNKGYSDNDTRYFFGVNSEFYTAIKEILDEDDLREWYQLVGDIAYDCERTINNINQSYQYIDNADSVDNEFDRDLFIEGFFRDNFSWEEDLLQLHRLTVGKKYLSDYKFSIMDSDKAILIIDIKPGDNMEVQLESPNDGLSNLKYSLSKNVFAIIGNNGSGKTSFIQALAKAFAQNPNDKKLSIKFQKFDTKEEANKISKIIYISYSPFDRDFNISQNDNEEEIFFEKIGLLESRSSEISLREYMTNELFECLEKIRQPENILEYKKWLNIIDKFLFESWIVSIKDIMLNDFEDKKITSLNDNGKKKDTSVLQFRNRDYIKEKISELSSGQKIILLSITKLILKVSERTVVFIDEPELFLHPPMVKAYIRAISDIITEENGLCFIVTHSPITLQEIPNECVKVAKQDYTGKYILEDLTTKTFGESISTINDSIFQMGLQQTGFYNFLEVAHKNGGLKRYQRQLEKILGSEGSMIMQYHLLEEEENEKN